VALDCEPVFGYGTERARWHRPETGYHQAVAADGNGLELTLTSDVRFGIEGSTARGRTLLREGDTRFCALSWGRQPPSACGRRPPARSTPTSAARRQLLAGEAAAIPWQS
jgi:alpha,alpha-trehalase